MLKSGENMLCTAIISDIQNNFLYTTCSPHFLQKEELLTKIYLYSAQGNWAIISFKWLGACQGWRIPQSSPNLPCVIAKVDQQCRRRHGLTLHSDASLRKLFFVLTVTQRYGAYSQATARRGVGVVAGGIEVLNLVSYVVTYQICNYLSTS